MTRSGRSALQHRLDVALLLGVFVFAALLFRGFTCDDAYITFRYALNAAEGHGLVFNPGERVEGFSSPLWLGLLFVAAKLGLDPVVTAKVLGVSSGIGALLSAYAIVRRLVNQDDWPSLVVLPLCGAGLAYYGVSGLETLLYAWFLTGAVYLFLRPGATRHWGIAFCAVGAALTRPEGTVAFGALLAWRAVPWRSCNRGERVAIVTSSLVSVAVLACFVLVRYSYFGAWLPNTYYAKPPGAFGGSSLFWPIDYVGGFLLDTGTWLWLACSVAWLKYARRGAVAMFLVLGAEVALVVHARGDWMALHRFLVPVAPIIVAFGYAGLLRVVSTRLVVGAVLILALAVNGVGVSDQLRLFFGGQYPQAVMAGRPQREAGEWLRGHFPPGTTLATKRIGGVGYYSRMPVVDMLGLVDRRIGAIRYESPTLGEREQARIAQEVFSRRPDLILLCVMKRWRQLPGDQPAPDIASHLLDVDRAVHAGLEKHGYRFLYRLPQGNAGEFAIFARDGLPVPKL